MRTMTTDIQELYIAVLNRRCRLNIIGPLGSFYTNDDIFYRVEIIENNRVRYKIMLSSYHEIR